MVEVGDTAPDFTLPMAQGRAYNDIEPFTLSEALEDGPVVLAFVPGAFTSGCTEEMCTFSDSLSTFDAVDAQVYGVSADMSFAQNVWMEMEDIDVPMLADQDRDVIREYDVILEDMYGYFEVAERAVFVVDTDGEVTWAWVRDGDNPDFEPFVDEVQAAVSALA